MRVSSAIEDITEVKVKEISLTDFNVGMASNILWDGTEEAFAVYGDMGNDSYVQSGMVTLDHLVSHGMMLINANINSILHSKLPLTAQRIDIMKFLSNILKGDIDEVFWTFPPIKSRIIPGIEILLKYLRGRNVKDNTADTFNIEVCSYMNILTLGI